MTMSATTPSPNPQTVLPPLELPWQPVSPRLQLGEGVCWSEDQQAFFGCDIDGGSVWRLRFDGTKIDGAQFDTVAHFTDPSACVQTVHGEWLVSARDGIYACSADFSQQRLWVPSPFDTAQERWNDARIGPDGAFWLMTIYEPRQPPLARLYRLDGTGVLTPQMQGLTVGNGLNWSADARTLLWADTTSHSVYSADFPLESTADPIDSAAQSAVLRLPRKTDLPEGQAYGGRPDGCARDETGHFWSACFEGGQLLRYGLDGAAVQSVPVPVRCPTMPCFGGPDGRTLIVTSASHKRPADELAAHPHSGHVLACRSAVAGPAPHRFQREHRFF
ncbi:SMP-30/gluconolactonase/LRE family protein [Amphibiibacter pelophylacis]|uniref:SMP-30/gluconolactonase/LRE family protein n=1 Tax=Amphibiibacter pelophylacis TaxID=1799477 RepID=A0ACC6P226_9BURK